MKWYDEIKSLALRQILTSFFFSKSPHHFFLSPLDYPTNFARIHLVDMRVADIIRPHFFSLWCNFFHSSKITSAEISLHKMKCINAEGSSEYSLNEKCFKKLNLKSQWGQLKEKQQGLLKVEQIYLKYNRE